MKRLAPLIMAVFCALSHADEPRHRQLAEEFDRLAFDKEKAIHDIGERISEQTPPFPLGRQEIEKQVREYSARPDVAAKRVRMYMETFTEAELEQLMPLIESPAYKLLQQKQFDVANPFFVTLIGFKLVVNKPERERN